MGKVWKGGEGPGLGEGWKLGKGLRKRLKRKERGGRNGESKKFQNQKKDRDKRRGNKIFDNFVCLKFLGFSFFLNKKEIIILLFKNIKK